MDFMSWMMPKLAWIIPSGLAIFILFILVRQIRAAQKDIQTKANGNDVIAIISNVVYDNYQNFNNSLSGVVSVEYQLKGRIINSERGIIFSIMDKDKIKPSYEINIRVSNEDINDFYFIEHKTI